MAQLISAQGRTALFSFCIFAPNLKFKFLSWHFNLKLFFDRNSYYENIWDLSFYLILSSIKITNCGNFACITEYTHVFTPKIMALEKVVIWKLLELPQKLPSQISVFFCNKSVVLGKSPKLFK